MVTSDADTGRSKKIQYPSRDINNERLKLASKIGPSIIPITTGPTGSWQHGKEDLSTQKRTLPVNQRLRLAEQKSQ